MAKPAWASAMGRDGAGLYAEVPWLGQRQRLDWRAPEGGKGGWIGAGPLGWDEYGLYADLTIDNATQRFRWIEPGSFLMGSPDDEPERFGDETQHPVTLTQGYWLADTACTQALWQALMREDPSRFSDDPDNPVETVSWKDAQAFVTKLNAAVPGLNACLPTEAQWEYACRAGTQTPFAFGGNITPEQVNYDGRYPYAGGEKRLYRKKNVPVRALPCNAWGLYQMHGNVWEWCGDWFGEYPAGEAIDPTAPEHAQSRVLRGGSWFNRGGFVRSAYRRRHTPDDCYGHFGFRLALGPQAGRQATEPAGASGRTAARSAAVGPDAPVGEAGDFSGKAGDEGVAGGLLARIKKLVKP
ncbi:MAG: formylglycine-generating enzyme family protein [Methylococcaceae bacterium]|nr:MAG: formylglycine-generating enzyme family protein [Methylococcaceae bacterium]